LIAATRVNSKVKKSFERLSRAPERVLLGESIVARAKSNPMSQFRLSSLAEADIEAILEWTHEYFGENARIRYEALLLRAILDIASDRNLPGSLSCPEIAADARIYHIKHSRDRVTRLIGRVRRPRHFLLYRLNSDGVIEISRVLHDCMDLDRGFLD
jgi:toxin ParE1/3/4